MGPHPAVARIRRELRLSLAGLPRGALVLAACSGGADSLALAACLGFAAPRLGLRAGLLTVDHGLQEGSRERAEEVARLAAGLGLEPAEALTVRVGTAGGPEAAAREARYGALSSAAERLGASAVLLGHTREDQAETVLLRLARGSGTRSLAGMPAAAGLYRRPLLGVARRATRAACEALGLVPWEDPHNADPAYTRVRVRHDVLPVLERALGPGVTEALARTAGLCRDDADALDAWADEVCARLGDTGAGLAVDELTGLPAAVRRRVIQRAALAAGAAGSALAAVHIEQVDRLITAWRGQRMVELPGGVGVVRRYGTLIFASTLT
ncbi:tRNA lysidine(34) synthetase TilS [Sphaerisporangium sp. NPDC005288]|uniref:tRNA lysidine(34) synthetase TilS n=1 Tax=Sphaerisporangium sp. NPDC005288 TaxID=3155114 RepID=UPI0033A940F5